MSMNKNIARLAVTAGLTVALSFGGVMAPVTMAFAEEGAAPSYSLTINQDADNGPTSFKAYQIFTADVMDGKSGKVTSNVEWASPAARTAVLDELVNNKATGITKDRPLLMLPTTFPRSLIPLIPRVCRGAASLTRLPWL